MKQLRKFGLVVIIAIPLLFLAFFFFYPLATVLRTGMTQAAWMDVLTRAAFWRVFRFTVWQAILSTLLTLVVGLPAAYLFAHYDFWGKGTLKALTTIPFVLPTVVVAAADSV